MQIIGRGGVQMLWCQFDSVVKSQVWHETPHRNECLAVFRTQETADTLVPPDCREDNPEIEVDSESGTIWFPLPRGRSIHTLSAYFGLPWPGLGACPGKSLPILTVPDGDAVGRRVGSAPSQMATRSPPWIRRP